eukprot:CAMPEP_0198233070 /NCGR_PEP_ID=MMETSP1445-20131203/116053_1 /TAXON_ID=36898 /ORGANISM="Pyramimonas sp., Strain CCMP2087" /LENGTH=127 /DNA_ID=CAMNT_0043913759 /DNA_START=665 /DNA_END=1045 /DNA_ORIENTATION=+
MKNRTKKLRVRRASLGADLKLLFNVGAVELAESTRVVLCLPTLPSTGHLTARSDPQDHDDAYAGPRTPEPASNTQYVHEYASRNTQATVTVGDGPFEFPSSSRSSRTSASSRILFDELTQDVPSQND